MDTMQDSGPVPVTPRPGVAAHASGPLVAVGAGLVVGLVIVLLGRNRRTLPRLVLALLGSAAGALAYVALVRPHPGASRWPVPTIDLTERDAGGGHGPSAAEQAGIVDQQGAVLEELADETIR